MPVVVGVGDSFRETFSDSLCGALAVEEVGLGAPLPLLLPFGAFKTDSEVSGLPVRIAIVMPLRKMV